MLKNIILKITQRKIDSLSPKVNIKLNKEIPIPCCLEIKKLAPLVSYINSLEEKFSKLSDSELKEYTFKFKKLIEDERKKYPPHLTKEEIFKEDQKILEKILPECFALVREAAKRTIKMRHFDVQILGGIVLHQGKIAEMATGEGKTLVATLPAFLNALSGFGVHIVTVNDYLAKRDREWMGPIYEFLGLKVGVIYHGMSHYERKKAYQADITYGTNNEFGFDYLRDNMVTDLSECVQRGHFYAIVDEVDSILIDEARTPLIISGPAEESTQKYYIADKIARKLKGRKILEKDEVEAKYKGIDLEKGVDYIFDEKTQNVSLTEEGIKKCEEYLGIDLFKDLENQWVHHIIQAIRAHEAFKRDRDYIVKDGKVIIVDEFTGRLMPGRRWSDGLHQAIEAKEGLKIERENQTLATITLQNYFKMYQKLAGMTGTAYTEANEFKQIYNLDVVVIPTNKPLRRTNFPDVIYKTEKEKFQAVVNEIQELYKIGRPVLVGTTSIEKSERLSEMLKKLKIPHQVLNAKYHEKEAYIVAQAGRYKAVTIATNMAGRGTDILLGGNPEYLAKWELLQKGLKPHTPEFEAEYKVLYEKYKQITDSEHKKVVELGGLHVIGTERHEARRIDNQLRGRAGRQGDPGSSRFYVSLEDDLMRLFASDRIMFIMDKLGWREGERLESPLLTKSIEIAQKRVENYNFDIRKQLLEFDNVMNRQREVIYKKRRKVLEAENLKPEILEILKDVIEEKVDLFCPPKSTIDEYDLKSLLIWASFNLGIKVSLEELVNKNNSEIKEILFKKALAFYEEKEKRLGPEMRKVEKMIYLYAIDSKWKDHLYGIDYLKEGIFLRSYGHRDPLVEFQYEAFKSFEEMLKRIEESLIENIFRFEPPEESKLVSVFETLPQDFVHQEFQSFKAKKADSESAQDLKKLSEKKILKVIIREGTYKREGKKIGRNDPCPCGSGKKYKKCCYPKYG